MKVTAIGTTPDSVRLARRARLVAAVKHLAIDMAAGVTTWEPIELRALAAVCDEHKLPVEAARVRRWIPESQT